MYTTYFYFTFLCINKLLLILLLIKKQFRNSPNIKKRMQHVLSVDRVIQRFIQKHPDCTLLDYLSFKVSSLACNINLCFRCIIIVFLSTYFNKLWNSGNVLCVYFIIFINWAKRLSDCNFKIAPPFFSLQVLNTHCNVVNTRKKQLS